MKIGGNNLELRTSSRALARRIVEKPHAAGNLRKEESRQPAGSAARAERRDRRRASRFGTNSFNGLDRRGIEARFVAQVLGQILGPAQDGTLLAARAYARSNGEHKETRLVRVL